MMTRDLVIERLPREVREMLTQARPEQIARLLRDLSGHQQLPQREVNTHDG